MIYIQTALQYEARPFISLLSLKKVRDIKRFQVYSGEDWRLIVSGVGRVRAAIASTLLLTYFEAGPGDFFASLGVCGTRWMEWKKGEMGLFNKIMDRDSGRAFFPDMLLRHPFREGSLETFSRVVEKGGDKEVTGDCVDMEASGAFEAASFFLPPHRISVIKTVFDHLEGGDYRKEEVEAVMTGSAPETVSWIKKASGDLQESQPSFSKEEAAVLESIIIKLKLTETMALELKKLVWHSKLKGSNLIEILGSYLKEQPRSKEERKKIFEKLREGIVKF